MWRGAPPPRMELGPGILPQDTGKVNFQQRITSKPYTNSVTGITGDYGIRNKYQTVGDMVFVFIDIFPKSGTIATSANWTVALPTKSKLQSFANVFRTNSFNATNTTTQVKISDGIADLSNSRITFPTGFAATTSTISIYGAYLVA